MESFISSYPFDSKLFIEEKKSQLAYLEALRALNIIGLKDYRKLKSAIMKLKPVELTQAEDLHYSFEKTLVKKTGSYATKIHTGRSRNEQVVTAELLYIRNKIFDIEKALDMLKSIVIKKAVEYIKTPYPVFTHLQFADFVYFSHYILSIGWEAVKAKNRFKMLYSLFDELPLGSGAVAGSLLEVDVKKMGKMLSFKDVAQNSIYITSTREFISDYLYSITILSTVLSRYAEDFIVLSNPVFGVVESELTTGSSLMPHKKNPDYLELIRGHSAVFTGELVKILAVMKGLPTGYNRDLQLDKEVLFAGDRILDLLNVFCRFISTLKINNKKVELLLRENDYVFSTSIAVYLAKKGIPFRDAHRIASRICRYAAKKNVKLRDIDLNTLKKFSNAFDVDVKDVFSIEKKSYQGSSMKSIKRQIEKLKCL